MFTPKDPIRLKKRIIGFVNLFFSGQPNNFYFSETLASTCYFKDVSFCYLRFLLIFGLFFSCQQKKHIEKQEGSIDVISVDLSQSRTGKLSEFFEPEINYIWLEDELEEAQLNSNLQQIIFHGDKIYALDNNGCKCISMFSKSGKYLGRIGAYGEGPGEYQNLGSLIVVKEELVLLEGVSGDIMWFSLEGEFLRESNLKDFSGIGVFSEFDDRFYFYKIARNSGEFFVQSLNMKLQDTINYMPYHPERVESEMTGRNYFQKSKHHLYFGMTFLDTIYQFQNQQLVPQFVFDYGNYGQDLEKLNEMEIMERITFMNTHGKLYFRGRYQVSEKQLYAIFNYENNFYNIFYDLENSQSNTIEGMIINDLDGGLDVPLLPIAFAPGKVGLTMPGKAVYQTLMAKKNQMGQVEYENWVKGVGANLAKTAFAGKGSENPVLIVYTLK
ncbi:6-bladed beta-propeller [Cyclobacterium marinum]|uniref:6-bladed beta-propeller n=1 Tax=Cyclobacterium marinum TaxID=104 RepID=UPI0011ED17F1|nr:6-bladed beta-propeller [Cyclobacterium marinum]MBI0397164.1 6-bladed beta-propeller [Cyclobacterium marinum]